HVRALIAVGFDEIDVGLVEADGENRDVRLAELLHGLIECVLGERVDAGCEQEHRLLSLNLFHLIDRSEHSVENVGLAESRKIEVVDRLAYFVFILREVDFDTRLHIEGDEGDPVFLLEVWEERVGPIFRLIGEPVEVTAAAELHDHGDGDGSIRGAESSDGLRRAIIDDTKILALEASENVAMLGGSDDVERDDGNFDVDRGAGFGRLLLLLWLRRRLLLRRRLAGSGGTCRRLGVNQTLAERKKQ